MLHVSPSSFEIHTFEIVFLVLLVLKWNIASFKIYEVSEQGLLADFGWKIGHSMSVHTNEVRDNSRFRAL